MGLRDPAWGSEYWPTLLAFDIDGHVKSLDALRLASCMQIGSDALTTPDRNMRDAAKHRGIETLWAG